MFDHNNTTHSNTTVFQEYGWLIIPAAPIALLIAAGLLGIVLGLVLAVVGVLCTLIEGIITCRNPAFWRSLLMGWKLERAMRRTGAESGVALVAQPRSEEYDERQAEEGRSMHGSVGSVEWIENVQATLDGGQAISAPSDSEVIVPPEPAHVAARSSGA